MQANPIKQTVQLVSEVSRLLLTLALSVASVQPIVSQLLHTIFKWLGLLVVSLPDEQFLSVNTM